MSDLINWESFENWRTKASFAMKGQDPMLLRLPAVKLEIVNDR